MEHLGDCGGDCSCMVEVKRDRLGFRDGVSLGVGVHLFGLFLGNGRFVIVFANVVVGFAVRGWRYYKGRAVKRKEA